MDPKFELSCPSFQDFLAEQGGDAPAGVRPLDFAHPIDAEIIRILDQPMINQIFSGIINLSTNANYGLLISSGIRLDGKADPAADILRHCAQVLRIPVPYTVVTSSLSGINAMTMGTDELSYIVVSSLAKALLSDQELTFVLGHECGHIALGHVLYHTVLSSLSSFASLLPIVGPAVYKLVSGPMQAWVRRSEISADRAGLLCCGDVNVACRTLFRIEAGMMRMEDADIDIEDYIRTTREGLQRNMLGRYTELFNAHPILAKRMEALLLFSRSEKYYKLSGKPVPEGCKLIDDATLNAKTEKIVSVLF